MNINVERKEFVKAVSKFLGIAEKNQDIPLLSAILIETDGQNKIRLFGANMEISLSDPSPAEVIVEGKFAIDCRKLYEIMKEFPDGKINLHLQENRMVRIVSGKSRFSIQTYATEEFPLAPALEEELQFEIKSADFLEMIKKTVFAAGEKDSRYVLNGILAYFKKNDQAASIRLVGTDGHRLAVSGGVVTCLSNGSCLEKKMIVPKKAVLEIKKLLSESDAETVRVASGQSQFTVTIGESRFSARMLGGSYPDYAQVIPKEFSRNITFRKEEIEGALRRVSILTDKNHQVKLAIDPEKAVFSSQMAESGQAEDEIPVLYQGEGFQTGFNGRYLLEALGAVDHEEVIMNISDPISPAAFKSPGDPNSLWVIMPMRV